MKRRVTVGKARQGKTQNLKRRRTAAVARSRASDANLKEQINRQAGELAEARKLLAEALEQQRASAEVLNVISNSVSKAEPVFEKIVESCERIFATSRVGVNLIGPDGLVHAGAYGKFPGAEKLRRENFPHPVAGSATGAVISAGRPIQYPDALSDSDVPPYGRRAAEIVGFRAFIMAPLLSEGRGLGAIFVGRETVGLFSNAEVALLKTFAAQAVIAIENTRLLNELRESLQQQTATADVLKTISSSPGELEPVFQAMLEKATRICEARLGTLWLREGDGYRLGALHGAPPAFAEARWREPVVHPGPQTGLGRIALTKQAVHIADLTAERAYAERDPLRVALVEQAGARTFVMVPMLRDNELIGTIAIYRQEVRPFTDKQIKLVQNFAAQAVIAIENARLLNELRESLQQQTAAADVLKVISTTTSDVIPVFEAILKSASRLCNSEQAVVFRFDGKLLHLAATENWPTEALATYAKRYPTPPNPHLTVGRVVLIKGVVIQEDTLADVNYEHAVAQAGGWRRMLGVPMMQDGDVIGVIVLAWKEPGAVLPRYVELLQTFAAQAVIAIENVRLFKELRSRTHELTLSLDDLRNTQDRLVQTQKLASLGQLTAGIAHEIKNPLNFVNNFSGLSAELVDELQQALNDGNFNESRHDELTELMTTLRNNLDKVVQHGKRADAIVKNMLLHSHQGSAEHRRVAINAIVEESLKLAYHGARAEKQNFNIMVEQSFDPVAGEADIFPQELTRVLLNLISNSVYATRDKTSPDGKIYRPTLSASTKDLGDRVEIKIRDNGTGIPPEIKEKMFNPFFTTKPAGEGTGLGLSISHDIIVKQHGGSIEVDTKPGEFTEIRIVLPRTAAFISS
jgi:two-component system, NtrC family, sensor kinase